MATWITDDEVKSILKSYGYAEEEVPDAMMYMEDDELLVVDPERGPVRMWYENCVYWVEPMGRG